MRTLLILVDGMRPDALTDIPVAQSIIKRSLSTMNARTVVPSVTLPCHISLFHSVDPIRHGTTTNTYAPQVRPIKGLCEVLKDARKRSAIFYSWEQLRDISRPGSLTYSIFKSGARLGYFNVGKMFADDAIKIINENNLDFTFVYFGHPDEAGHDCGWMGEKYLDSVKTSWDNIEKILNNIPDDYAVIITADHGGHDRTHGTELPEDMTIPIIMLGNGIDTAGDISGANIKDIAPTVTKLLGIEPDPDWEGKSLV